ncbi:unnamed protein product, partial [Sphenostylis stenocarpa]
ALGKTTDWFRTVLSVKPVKGNLRLSGYSTCGQDGGVQFPHEYVEALPHRANALLNTSVAFPGILLVGKNPYVSLIPENHRRPALGHDTFPTAEKSKFTSGTPHRGSESWWNVSLVSSPVGLRLKKR